MPTLTKKKAAPKKAAPGKQSKRSKPFSSLTKAEQRVQIAKDTLKWLETKNIKIKTGSYLQVDNAIYFDDNVQANKHLDELKCQVCAKGALFLSHIDKFNHCTIGDFQYASHLSIIERLTKHFTRLQLDMIETAFEQSVQSDGTEKLYEDFGNSLTPLGKKCVAFGKQYRKPKERLTAILKNIIKNKGEFKP